MTTHTTATRDDWSPTTVDEYPAEYARLRAEAPLAYTCDYDGFYGFMRYADVQKNSRDWKTYKSGQPFVEFPEFMKSIPIQSNPPQHTFFRKFLQQYFVPARIAMLAPDIEQIVADNLDPLIERGGGDMINEFGVIVPQQVLAKFLGLPAAAWETMADSLARADAVRHDLEKHREINKTLWNPTVEALIEDRRVNPQDPSVDIMSGVLQLQPEGRAITHEEAVAIGVQIFSAGADTTTAAMGSIMVHLGNMQSVQQELRSDPTLVSAAVEEVLRLAPPLHQTRRHATRDVQAYGQVIPEGVKVALNVYSANRDEAKFDDGDTFDLHRARNPHLTFGHGPHQCMGSPIAREELRATLEQILAKTAGFTLDGPPESNGRPLRTGWSHVRVHFDRA
ncbi:cytochrome P450 [Gordonia otitidis]|uniref:Cytochrome P450 n=1 Tax=Gordonia otitidis (strain DSM 44809 / CCUG 52243 / JCM 12355 / NBRC 100426 / IFM 10032) TaxID=1108044 RepID=H5THB6_GORO1|nr:cytochrome P450 [Gordonia otitidis]GAB32874.1 putative cytochrome P450 [Gordonia otitidis NBRC 100426]